MATQKKTAEAESLVREAEKCLKTSWTKWKADFDGAAHAYDKAGLCYRHAKLLADAKATYVKAAECHRQCKAFFHAAKSYEHAGLILKDMSEFEEAVHYIKKAASMYREHGTNDTAAITLEKAAKMVESVNASVAIELYNTASEIAENEDRIRQAVDSTSKAARLAVRVKDYDQALELLKKARDMYDSVENLGAVYKLVAVIVLVHLHRNDFVAASKVCQVSMSYDGYAMDEVSGLLEELLEGFDQQDQETISRITLMPYFTYLDNDYVKLARSLRVPGDGGGGGSSKQQQLRNKAADKSKVEQQGNVEDEEKEEEEEEGKQGEGEEDEYAGGLC